MTRPALFLDHSRGSAFNSDQKIQEKSLLEATGQSEIRTVWPIFYVKTQKKPVIGNKIRKVLGINWRFDTNATLLVMAERNVKSEESIEEEEKKSVGLMYLGKKVE